jgi:glycine betaine/choline ABC-type transport system substrate-binding protein
MNCISRFENWQLIFLERALSLQSVKFPTLSQSRDAVSPVLIGGKRWAEFNLLQGIFKCFLETSNTNDT